MTLKKVVPPTSLFPPCNFVSALLSLSFWPLPNANFLSQNWALGEREVHPVLASQSIVTERESEALI